MRKLTALLLSAAILAQACAGAPKPSSPQIPPALAAVNQKVEDQPVTLELASGEVVREVEGLVMTTESTSWFDGEHARTVPTAEVCKVIRQTRHRLGKGYAWGLLACAPVAIGISRSDNDHDPLASIGSLLVSEGLCAFIGMFVALATRQSPDRVVYTAPGACGPAK